MSLRPRLTGEAGHGLDSVRRGAEFGDHLDLSGPGFIEFSDDGFGELGFIAVSGELDWRDADPGGRLGVEFSWQGSDEGDEASGRGWAALSPDGTLEGHIFIYLGDDSGFRADRFGRVVR